MRAPRIAKPPHASQAQTTHAQLAADMVQDVIVSAVLDHPRSKQKRIGPSEIGMPCTRRLLHKLNKDTEPDELLPLTARPVGWRATVGTACHAQMEEWFTAPGRADEGYLVEERLTVGAIGGEDITGSCDLFNRYTGVVLDWKFVGTARLKQYKAKGPGAQYRSQAHLYGKGWEDDGHAVTSVMIVFAPRDGDLEDAFWWWEPYDRHVADEALTRANALHQTIQMFGIDAALSLYPPCSDPWCPWCAKAHAAAQASSPFAVPR